MGEQDRPNIVLPFVEVNNRRWISIDDLMIAILKYGLTREGIIEALDFVKRDKEPTHAKREGAE